MTTFQYVVVKYVPNILRDESVNVGIIVRDENSEEFGHRFLSRGAAVRRLWPSADTEIVRHLDRELERMRRPQLALDGPPSLGRAGNPGASGFFGKAREEFTGNLQLTLERGLTAESLADALRWAFSTFVAEPAAHGRPINYQALAPSQTRERLWRAFERRSLIGPRRVRQRVVLEGRHAPWTFDLGYQNGALHLINSLALNAAASEANLGRALVFKGMLEEVADKTIETVMGIAVIQWPKAKPNEDAATAGAVAILEDAGVETFASTQVDELATRVERDLAHRVA